MAFLQMGTKKLSDAKAKEMLLEKRFDDKRFGREKQGGNLYIVRLIFYVSHFQSNVCHFVTSFCFQDNTLTKAVQMNGYIITGNNK